MHGGLAWIGHATSIIHRGIYMAAPPAFETDHAVDYREHHLTLRLDRDQTVEADFAVMPAGNFPPAPMPDRIIERPAILAGSMGRRRRNSGSFIGPRSVAICLWDRTDLSPSRRPGICST